jgi:Na+/H+ antiporter NhaD/arsenite permease-like protein
VTNDADINVLFPFQLPVFIPRAILRAISKTLAALRIHDAPPRIRSGDDGISKFVRLNFPMTFVTTPLIANLFLLAILAIGRREVHDGTIGANNIAPYDIMLFFISLAYIAISIDASGLIRYLAYRVLQSGGNAGHRLYLSLYAFFFALTAAIGNDPIILSGTPFLAYMTRVSANIDHPRAWIYSQFSVANIASAILVSSNPTNLVVAGAFNIRFINYSGNVVVPVIVTSVLLFPFLLYVVFRDATLVPKRIEMHQLSEEAKEKKPVNPNIPIAGSSTATGFDASELPEKVLPLEEIMNPYIDKVGATVAASILAITLVTLLIVNAVTQGGAHKIHAFWVTAPAAVITFAFDLVWGWMNRHESRRISCERRIDTHVVNNESARKDNDKPGPGEKLAEKDVSNPIHQINPSQNNSNLSHEISEQPFMLTRWIATRYRWFRITFPTAATVLAGLPYALVPFAFCMFVLVQALVTKGWVPVFAYGWDAWVAKTGTVGAVGGMGFLAVILSNVSSANCLLAASRLTNAQHQFAGTNIGTSILLSRIIQAWQNIHTINGTPISDRNFWASVYAMVIGVNYGAFSIAFSASLAGLLWRDILRQKFIHVRSRDFVLVNLPIIVFTMVIGMSVLLGQIYIVRTNSSYNGQ